MENKLIRADRIFTGSEWLNNHVMIVADDTIVDLIPETSLLSSDIIHNNYKTIIPSLIDIQIYGAHNKLVAIYPDKESIYHLRDYCAEGGALYFMPTVATNSYETIFSCIDAVKSYWDDGGKGCLGLHVEGPWINPVRKGAHIESLIHAPSLHDVRKLLDYGKNVIRFITIAPEICSEEAIKLIQDYGITISAGHSNATYQEANLFFDKGINAATHLFNAMSPFQHRAPGLTGALFNHPSVMASIVPDGYHVDFAAIRIAKKLMHERLFVITDAVTETTEGFYPHHLDGDRYISNGILSGSALTMMKSIKNLVQFCDIGLSEAIRMCSLYPAKVLGIKDLGRLEKGYKASYVELTIDFGD